MKALKNIELIIFDLDGTLVNSQFDLADAVNHALGKLNRPFIKYEQVPAMLGGGVNKLLELALNNYTKEEFKKAHHHFVKYYNNNYTNKTKAYPDVISVLNFFDKKKKAVYSNKVHAFTVEIISKLGLNQYFEKVIGARPELYKKKPSPEGIFLLLKELNISSENAIMVGDSTHDLHAAQAAGIFSCAVTYGYRSTEVLKTCQPDLLIDQLSDLKKYIAL